MLVRARVPVAAAVAIVVGLTACSGDDSGDAGSDEPTPAEYEADAASTGEGAADDPAGAAAVPSTGCEGEPTPEVGLEEHTLDVRGSDRRYLVSAPAWDGGAPPPLVLDFHGLAEGADVHAQMTQLGPLGVEEGFVTAFPHGTGQPLRWDTGGDPETNDDLAYVAALLDTLEADRCIDTARVYATGLSNGAMMTSTVACTMADRIAAVAPVAGIQLPDDCDPARPVPVLTFHGTDDPILLFNGGIDTSAISGVLGDDEDGGDGGDGSGATTTTRPPVDLEGAGYPETVAGWAELNGCEASFDDEDVSDTVFLRSYECPPGAPVEFYVVDGGGHSWPSSEFSASIEDIVGLTTFDIDASELAWEFFQRFSLPAD